MAYFENGTKMVANAWLFIFCLIFEIFHIDKLVFFLNQKTNVSILSNIQIEVNHNMQHV